MRAIKSGKIIIEEIEIGGGDHTPIKADIRTALPGGELPLVIICHGFLAYKRWGFYPYVSERLAESNFHVLTMSFSMNGTDEDTGMITKENEFAANTVSRELSDLRKACAFAQNGPLPLDIRCSGWGILGHSRGAAVAILAASEFERIRSIVTWATPSRLDRYTQRRKEMWKRDGALVFSDGRSTSGKLRLDYSYYEDIAANRADYSLPDRAAELTIPHLMIHGRRDAAVTVSEAERMLEPERAGRVVFEVLEDCGHTFGIRHPMRRVTRELEKAVGLTLEWFKDTLIQ